MTMNLKSLLTLSACLLASLALLAGCGDDEESGAAGGGGEGTEIASDAAPTEVYKEFQAALAGGDADTACSLLAPSGL